MANQFKINENLAYCHFVLIWNGSQRGNPQKNVRLILIPFRNRAHFFFFFWAGHHKYLYLLNFKLCATWQEGSQVY